MKLALAILALLVFVLSLWADHKWRQWMKSRQSTTPDQPSDSTHRRR